MNREELKIKLDGLKISPIQYSLYNKLDPDRMVMYDFYGKWIVFYLNGEGKRTNEHTFYSEAEACQFMLDQFIGFIQFRDKNGLETGRK